MTIPSKTALAAAALLLALPTTGHAQSVVLDEGTFRIWVDGREVGTEEFTIRRAGMGSDATIIAHAVVALDAADGARELRPVLEAVPADGTAAGYQLKISGSEATELSVNLAGGRYVSMLRSNVGEEEREFLARPETRIVETWVAHQYYFLRNVREGTRAPIIEPRSRRQVMILVGPWVDETLTLGASEVPARRVEFRAGDEVRIVWFDQQGRVLRVEVPSLGYRAQRDDLVG
ncbi:MAG: hypothetical protein RJQ04_11685 [Longimicrobiales bacterium]